MGKLSWIFAVLLVISISLFGTNLTELIETEFIELEMGETVTIETLAPKKYYILYNNTLPASYFEVSQSTIYSLVEFEGLSPAYGDHAIFINIRNSLTSDRVYVEGYSQNTSVQINDQDALGRVELPGGTYQITITPATLDTQDIQDEFVFTITPTSFISNLLITIFSAIGVVTFFILFLVFYSQLRTKRRNELGYEQYQYEQSDPNKYYNMSDDDIFEQYDKRR